MSTIRRVTLCQGLSGLQLKSMRQALWDIMALMGREAYLHPRGSNGMCNGRMCLTLAGLKWKEVEILITSSKEPPHLSPIHSLGLVPKVKPLPLSQVTNSLAFWEKRQAKTCREDLTPNSEPFLGKTMASLRGLNLIWLNRLVVKWHSAPLGLVL